MKAAVIPQAGAGPVYGEFQEPVAREGFEVVTMSASALSRLSRARSSGRHYSSDSVFPAVAGVDGVGRTANGRRVYFALPEAPFGALAEKALVRADQCVAVPEALDDVTAAALANPGMSAWAAMVYRAKLVRGETVLVNGATGSAGTIAVQLAKYLGAGKVIATGRNEEELKKLMPLGADVVVPFVAGEEGMKAFEQRLIAEFASGIDVVVDYLWGSSARAIIVAIARAVDDARPVRFVQVGEAAGEGDLALPAAALRSSAIELMGSGLKSVPFAKLLEGVGKVFEAAIPASLEIKTKSVPLSEIAAIWDAPGKPRIVVTIP